MTYRSKFILLFIAILIGVLVNGQNHYHFKASHFDYSSKDTLVKFNFDIKHFKDYDIFNVNLSAVDKNQKSYNVNSLFEHKDLKGGKNTIFWNPLLDGYKLDGDYQINLELRKSSSIKISYRNHIVKSLLFPGWGDMRLRNSNRFILFGIGAIAYGSLLSSLNYNSSANKNYEYYINSAIVEESNNYFLNAKKNANISRILAGLTAITWTADLFFLTKRINNVIKDRSLSNFYNQMQNRKSRTNKNNYKYLITKKNDERYLDSAILEFENNNYKTSLNYLKQAKKYKSSDSLITEKVKKFFPQVENQIKYLDFHDTAIVFHKQNNLVMAKKYFNAAKSIFPEGNLNQYIIDNINIYESFLKKADSLFKIKYYDSALTFYQKGYFLYEKEEVRNKIIEVQNFLKFESLLNKGDLSFKKNELNNALVLYTSALKIISNKKILDKIEKTEVLINKNNQFQKFVLSAERLLSNSEPEQAHKYFLKANSIHPNKPFLKIKIDNLNEFIILSKNAEFFFQKNLFKKSKIEYEKAIILFNSNTVSDKIDKIEKIIFIQNLISEADQFYISKSYSSAYSKYLEVLKISPENSLSINRRDAIILKYKELIETGNQIYTNAKKQKSIIMFKQAIKKYEEASSFLSFELEPQLFITKCNDAILEIKNSQKKYADEKTVIDKEWMEIYNKNGLKVELRFDFSPDGCYVYPTTFKYKYNGRLESQEKFINWSTEFFDCNGSKRIFSSGVPIGGVKIKNKLGQGKLEDSIKEDNDDNFTNKKGKNIKTIYSIKVFSKKRN